MSYVCGKKPGSVNAVALNSLAAWGRSVSGKSPFSAKGSEHLFSASYFENYSPRSAYTVKAALKILFKMATYLLSASVMVTLGQLGRV